MSDYQVNLSQQATSKTKETNRLLGRRAVWDKSDEKCLEQYDRDSKDTEFMVALLERHEINLRLEGTWLVPTIGSKCGIEPTYNQSYKENAILPLTARKRKREDARTDAKFFQLCGGRTIGKIIVDQGDEEHTQHEYSVPGTFGSMSVSPYYCVLSSGATCSVYELKERYRILRRMVKAINDIDGVNVQRWTIEVTIREFSWGVTFHPHVNVIYTTSKSKIPSFQGYVTKHITQGKYWKNVGKITPKDAGRIAHYINKIPTKKADDECGDGGVDSRGEKGKIITLLELAERHEAVFVEFYHQQFGIKLNGYESQYKEFKSFLDLWGYDVKNVKTEVSGWDKRFNKKSNKITINDRQKREQEKAERAIKKRAAKQAKKAADKAKVQDIERERDRVIKAVKEYSAKSVKAARTEKKAAEKRVERSTDDKQVQEQKIRDIRSQYEAAKQAAYDERAAKEAEVKERYKKRIEATRTQIKEQRQREEEEERQRKKEEREKNKKGRGENVVIARQAPRKCKKLGCYEAYIMVKNYQPVEDDMSKASRENWQKLQELITDGCIIAEGNGFDFETMQATEMVYEDSFHLVNAAWYSLFDVEQPDYTRADFLEDIGLWHDRHFDDHDWNAVIAPTFDTTEVNLILEGIRSRWGDNMVTACSVLFLYRDLTFWEAISGTPAENSPFSDNKTPSFLHKSIDVTQTLPPDVIVGSLEDTFDWPPDGEANPQSRVIYTQRQIELPF